MSSLSLINAMLPRLACFRTAQDMSSRRSQPITLAEQIGYTDQDRILIINCDDLGCSQASNRAIERALRKGLATSATLMVPCPFAREAAEACRDLDIGVHLTLNSEYPNYRWRSLTGATSLADRDGYLPRTTQEIWARADIADVERECAAQIERALEWGIDVSHIDSHMDTLQLDGEYFAVYIRLAMRFGLPVRLRRMGFVSPFSSMTRAKLDRHGVVTTDYFMTARWGDEARPTLLKCIERPWKGVTEYVLHPVDECEELFQYDSENAEIRVTDAAVLMDDGIRALIASKRIKLIGYKPLRDAMRRAHAV